MAIQPKLDQFPSSPVRMGYSFFKSIRDRIETVAPIPTSQEDKDALISVKYVDSEGCKITFNGKPILLNVCSNGVPAQIKILVAN